MTQVPKLRIGKGINFIHGVYNGTGSGSEWALVKLDLNVVKQADVRLMINRRKKVKK